MKRVMETKKQSKKLQNRKISLRRCVGCMDMKEKTCLVRVVLVCAEKSEYAVDQTGKAKGRGAYMCKNTECFLQAKKVKGLERSFKCKIPEYIYEELHKMIEVITKSE